MLGPKQQDELEKLIDLQVENEKLKDKLESVEDKLRKRIIVYNETYACSQDRKQKIKELNDIIGKEIEKREIQEEDFNDKLETEKKKSKGEKDKRVKATNDKNKLETENKSLQDQLREAKVEWLELNTKKEEL